MLLTYLHFCSRFLLIHLICKHFHVHYEWQSNNHTMKNIFCSYNFNLLIKWTYFPLTTQKLQIPNAPFPFSPETAPSIGFWRTMYPIKYFPSGEGVHCAGCCSRRVEFVIKSWWHLLKYLQASHFQEFVNFCNQHLIFSPCILCTFATKKPLIFKKLQSPNLILFVTTRNHF